MCGIVGYIGKREAWPILIKGLERLEYRGYDSAGVAIISGGDISVYKKKGKVQELKNFTEDKNMGGAIGIAHTRWATHGEPSDRNSHPHLSNSGGGNYKFPQRLIKILFITLSMAGATSMPRGTMRWKSRS